MPRRKQVYVYTPDQMKVLQQVFESLWDELEQAGRVHMSDANMRQYVSGLVMAHATPDYLNVANIKEHVRRALKLAS
jgi:predicted transcriptional regulator